MKYYIYSKEDKESQDLAKYIRDSLIDEKEVFNRPFDKKERGFVFTDNNPDFVITIGGDGTFLRAIHQFKNELNKTMFIGVHTGKLGFFCDYKKDEIDILINQLKHQQPKTTDIRILKLDYGEHSYYGVNEVRVESPFTTMNCHIYINGELLENYRGNGLSFSTSTGSSAYNRSLGGPLVDPKIETILMAEVAGIHHNAYRSLESVLVLDGNEEITLKGSFKSCLVGYDHLSTTIDANEANTITISLSNRTVHLMHFQKVSYLKRLRTAFISD